MVYCLGIAIYTLPDYINSVAVTGNDYQYYIQDENEIPNYLYSMKKIIIYHSQSWAVFINTNLIYLNSKR